MLFSDAMAGFLLFKLVENSSERTIQTYKYHLSKFVELIGDKSIAQYNEKDIICFFVLLRERKLSQHTIKSAYIALCSFSSWCRVELGAFDIMDGIPAPKIPAESSTQYYTEQQIKQLIMATKETRHKILNETVILVLLDTGIRANEFCNLKIADYEMREARLRIIAGKSNKERNVYIGKRTQKSLWRYMNTKRDPLPSDWLFTNAYDNGFTDRHLRGLINRIGEIAGVDNCYPHRFRHTFAIEYLRNGGDLFTLQKLLGHSSLKMVRYYARVADVDTARVHKYAGPVDNMLK